jgi:hypothetical protein
MFVKKLKTHNSVSINIFQKIVILMKLCTIILYDQTGHSRQYGQWPLDANQNNAVITHSEYVIFISFPLQQELLERASLFRYT